MKILLKNAIIVDQESSHHLHKKDILINENGVFENISESINYKEAKILKIKNLHISRGWTDLNTRFGEPGLEYKEDIISGLNAAAEGGFTHIALMPSTEPCIQSKSDIIFLKNESAKHFVEIHPIGALTVNREGKRMTEMFDMQRSGAVAFSDDKRSISNSKLMKTALLYQKNFNGLILSFSSEEKIFDNGQINESKTSTKLGLPGIPSLAEEIQLAKDIQICEYTNGRIHFSTLSSSKSIDLIRKAKEKGLNVTCDVSSLHILLDERSLEGFDTNLKVNPPLRSIIDINELKKGLKDGTIDAISSNHNPQNIENKNCEFNLSSFGMINLETSFAVCNMALKKNLSISEIIEKITIMPQKILGLKQDSIEIGSKADITLFDPNLKWRYNKNHIISKSKNSGLIGKLLIGKPLGVFNKNNLHLCK